MDATIGVVATFGGVVLGAWLSYYTTGIHQRRQFALQARLDLLGVFTNMWAPKTYEDFRSAVERFDVHADIAGASPAVRLACVEAARQCQLDSRLNYLRRESGRPTDVEGGVPDDLFALLSGAKELLLWELDAGPVRRWRRRASTEARANQIRADVIHGAWGRGWI